jgi:hypothetical protein
MQKELNFIVMYGKETFFFKQGSKAFILHTGIENDIDKKYGMQELRDYVSFVHDCYIADDNHTPLGALADYIATDRSAMMRELKRLREEELIATDGRVITLLE